MLLHGKEKGKPKYPISVTKAFIKKIALLSSLSFIDELTKYHSLHFEKLKGNLIGLFSIRVNDQYRIVFSIEKESTPLVEIIDIIDLTDYH